MPAQKQRKTKPAKLVYEIQRISELMLEKKALDVKIIDVRKITTLTDFFIICTSASEPQTRAITDHIHEQMKKDGINVWHIEGYENLIGFSLITLILWYMYSVVKAGIIMTLNAYGQMDRLLRYMTKNEI